MEIAAYWEAIADTVQDGLLVIDAEGNIRAANEAAARMTGYAKVELIGQSCRVLNCNGCSIIGKGSGENWCGLFSKGMVREKKCLIINRDGRAVHISKTATVLRDGNGQIVGAVENLTDITDNVRQQQELASLRQAFQLDDGYCGILGKSPVMQNLYALIENVSQSDAPVVILGQSGTGKELAARAVHETGPRKSKPFIKVNCAALNENVLESELFGHVRGAYTGADRTRIGRFEAAHEGTIFLDEIGDLPLSIQVKLLRVLEEKKIERVGDQTQISVNVRIITATHKNLDVLIEKHQFREDLFFRINVFPLHCPPLAERTEDIPLIAQHFIRLGAEKTGKKILGLTPEAMGKLMAYPWPGNIRELRNAIEYAFVLCSGGGIDVRHLPPKLAQSETPVPEASIAGKNRIDEARGRLIEALEKAGGSRNQAARILGVSRVTLWKRMKKHNIR